jgi:phosphatidylinositol-3-phosphatase
MKMKKFSGHHFILETGLVIMLISAACSPIEVQTFSTSTLIPTQQMPTFVIQNPTTAPQPTNLGQQTAANTPASTTEPAPLAAQTTQATQVIQLTAAPVQINTPQAPAAGSSSGQVPKFSHVIVMIFENEEITNIIGNSSLPNFNKLAQHYTLLTSDFAVTHPSLPNYIALTSGDTQGIASDCSTCFVNVTNLPDLIEKSGRSWKAYMEDMPAPCTITDQGNYAEKHNPFVYYDDIRTNAARCQQHDVPLTQLDSDLQNKQLPNYAWITPNLCNDGHDCGASAADKFLGPEVDKIISSPAFDQNSLLIITFDEGTTAGSCCGMPKKAGGKITTLLISKLVKAGFQDDTPYTHYSILKTIEDAWGLPQLGHSADALTPLITDAWK